MMKAKSIIGMGGIATCLAFGLTSCSSNGDTGGTNGAEIIKTAWIYVGPLGDLGWSYAHDQGRLAVELNVDNVETSYIENVVEDDTATQVLNDLVEEGNKIIFGTTYGLMDTMLAFAETHSDIYFEHCSGYKTAANMSNYFGRMYQTRYLTGIVAGKMTDVAVNKIGYVAAFAIPEVIRGINAFTLGVRSVNPTATVNVEWTGTWYDVAKEGEAADKLLDAGCDVLAQHQDSTEPVLRAKTHGVYAIGYDTDMLPFATDTILTSAIWNWSAYYSDRVKAAQNGTWTSHSYWGEMSEGIVDLGQYGGMVPEDVKTLVDAKKTELADGTFEVFAGPINKQDASEWVAKGSSLTDKQLLQMEAFVEGVVGDI
ncbi:MAG: BMP family ABC transporter substrate-binding protein [Gammaproteobacteria bacterium]|nr:BMP family ABC transporter substrate-binding protein [Gammaproteobacteria bacterium]